MTRGYRVTTAQLQAGRATDLLGVAYADRSLGKARYVLHHPGFTRSGDRSPLSPPMRLLLAAIAGVAAQPVAKAIHPVHGFLDSPPAHPLTAVDRGKAVDLSLKSLDPANARRLLAVTEELLGRRAW
ncbi:hypothetical protein V5P93_001214 [Actinokineospora auranticolor]|uniref:Uncharacterized protein n=1 Tax=Actinokineospora auranticolor TaxID=155976 RepID=A0A2S6GUF3_9PSEU|nr:hypothetical protein [Actinokineospora auranticolor]PPK68840.1 hypothetical protein CLV40_10484 [Actinokineospora auranticolor]